MSLYKNNVTRYDCRKIKIKKKKMNQKNKIVFTVLVLGTTNLNIYTSDRS